MVTFSSYSVLNDSTIINAIIPANAFPGTCRVGVSSYGGTTRLGTYTVKPPVPIVTTVSPSTYSNLNDLQGVTINGQYFFGNTTIQRVATINLNDLVNPPIFTYFPSTDIKITNASPACGSPVRGL